MWSVTGRRESSREVVELECRMLLTLKAVFAKNNENK
jgi:hypothetical protein